MINKCKNCGSKLQFNPKDKGCACVNCGSIFPIKYNLNNTKYNFSNADKLNLKTNNQVKSFRCSTCGAIIVVDKNDIKSKCIYCGNTEISQIGKNKMMDINSVIPFEFNKTEAIEKINTHVKNSFFANKKIFKGLTAENIDGVYVNAFVFDFNVVANYNGVLTYTETYKDKKGNWQSRTRYKHVKGVLNSNYENLAIESNSHLDQQELNQVLPFNYAKTVDFKTEFTYGYSLEYHDEQFDKCCAKAENIVINDIKRQILRKYRCDNIESLDLNMQYEDRKYNYCLLPVYFINKKYKEKNYRFLMNGQTGVMGKLPKNIGRILLLVFSIIGVVAGAILLAILLSM